MTFVGRLVAFLAACLLLSGEGRTQKPPPLPEPLVFLADIDPSIVQDIRYATANNFTGRPVAGYGAGECVLLRGVALAISRVQKDLASEGYGLKVYDCYRPERAVNSFAAWARKGADDPATRRFHPRVPRSGLVGKGYIGSVSLHSQGRAVDVTLVRLPAPAQAAFEPAAAYGACNAPKAERAPDNGVDMGTDFDCFDSASHVASADVNAEQRRLRRLLAAAMELRGFSGYAQEWWHFSHPSREAGRRSFDVVVPARAR
jgi:D-alanyl-D-alanine dipeptidase